VLADFSNSRAQSQHLFDLGQALARAHYESRNQVLARANATLSQLRQSVLALVALLFLFGLALALLAYRDLIVPLRVKLVETQSLAERHEKLASLGMLAAGVAHEIRNPLTAIKAAVFMQQKKFPPGSPEAADAALVQREILRLERIVTQFLQFARPAEPELATIPSDQPLKEVQSSSARPWPKQHPAFARRFRAAARQSRWRTNETSLDQPGAKRRRQHRPRRRHHLALAPGSKAAGARARPTW
jgi:signal transduction histidine kinase